MEAIDLIKKWEGCSLKSYLCPAKKWTIGYGNTFHLDGSPVRENETCTQDEADKMLSDTVMKVKNQILASDIRLNALNKNQFEAVTSLVYNIGIGNFRTSTLFALMVINPNNLAIAEQFRAWRKAGGKVLPGLVKRREDEVNLYFS